MSGTPTKAIERVVRQAHFKICSCQQAGSLFSPLTCIATNQRARSKSQIKCEPSTGFPGCSAQGGRFRLVCYHELNGTCYCAPSPETRIMFLDSLAGVPSLREVPFIEARAAGPLPHIPRLDNPAESKQLERPSRPTPLRRGWSREFRIQLQRQHSTQACHGNSSASHS